MNPTFSKITLGKVIGINNNSDTINTSKKHALNETSYQQDKHILKKICKTTIKYDEKMWNYNFNEVKKYINANNKNTSHHNKDTYVKKLDNWIREQKQNYKKDKIQNESKNNKWTEFINDPIYKKYLYNSEDIWSNKLNEVKEYIDTNNKRPSSHDKNNNIKKLGDWCCIQNNNYKKGKMKNDSMYDEWFDFINDPIYKNYFISNEDKYIKKLDNWLIIQNFKIKNKIMKNILSI